MSSVVDDLRAIGECIESWSVGPRPSGSGPAVSSASGRPSFRVRTVAPSANVKTNTRMIAEVAVRNRLRAPSTGVALRIIFGVRGGLLESPSLSERFSGPTRGRFFPALAGNFTTAGITSSLTNAPIVRAPLSKSPQVGMALARIRNDETVTAIYGFSVSWLQRSADLERIDCAERERIQQVRYRVALGSQGRFSWKIRHTHPG